MLKSFGHQDAKWYFDAPEWAPSTASFAPEQSRQYLKSRPLRGTGASGRFFFRLVHETGQTPASYRQLRGIP
jgi:hypothetical protein